MIKSFIIAGYITPSQWRAIELFILGTLSSLLIGIIDNFEAIMNWTAVDWKAFFITFGTTTAVAVLGAVKKYIRDQALTSNQ